MMKLLDLYKPFVESESKFLDQYPQETQDIAQNFWNSLNSNCIFFVAFLLGTSILLCAFYFTVWNELPGRHYRRSHWICSYIITVLISFFGTVALGYLLCNTSLNGTAALIWDIALANLVYSFFIFGFLSVVWWLWLPTNAYRLIGNK